MIATALMQMQTASVPPRLNDRVEWHLENWARWMRRGERPEGLPRSSCGGMVKGFTIYTGDMDEVYDRMDAQLARTTEAAVKDLTPVEQCALHNEYLETVYRFAEPVSGVLARAKEGVQRGLRRRGVWVGS